MTNGLIKLCENFKTIVNKVFEADIALGKVQVVVGFGKVRCREMRVGKSTRKGLVDLLREKLKVISPLVGSEKDHRARQKFCAI